MLIVALCRSVSYAYVYVDDQLIPLTQCSRFEALLFDSYQFYL